MSWPFLNFENSHNGLQSLKDVKKVVYFFKKCVILYSYNDKFKIYIIKASKIFIFIIKNNHSLLWSVGMVIFIYVLKY